MRRLRRWFKWSLWGSGILIVLLVTAYLLRRPLFQSLLLDELEAALGDALEVDVSADALGHMGIVYRIRF